MNRTSCPPPPQDEPAPQSLSPLSETSVTLGGPSDQSALQAPDVLSQPVSDLSRQGSGHTRQRYVTKDGKCQVNLGPIAEKRRFLSDIFTTLVDLKYRWFLLVFSLCYVLTWLAFGAVYFLGAWLRDDIVHAGDPQWKPCFEKVDGFLSALLLSLESQRTIGYGSRMVTAHCPEGVVLLMVQSIVGSIIDALMVGCMFVKISRPQQRAQTLIFSKHCVICERDDKLCMLFRIGDLRESHMVDAKVRAKLIKSRQTKEGEFIPLEQSEINLGYDTGGDRLLLVEPQTITHIINDSSPFWEVGAERLCKETFEIIVILEGIVEASGMTCQARTSYTEDEVLWGHRFESCISLEKEAFRVDHSAFDKTFEVQMSTDSAKELDPCSRESVLKVLKESRKREVEEEGSSFTAQQKSKRR
uniref:G protein-activated inward rectifier potassium channel 3 n=1 Tax=Periophthalmus magnuspinnatus TaxID=409849 RepID=A0A3B4B2X4_9GOBI